MPLILSTQDWDELWEADVSSKMETYHPDPFETKSVWSSSLEEGWCRTIKLRNLWLTIREFKVTEDVIFKMEPTTWGPASSFFISGTMKNCHQGLTDENLEAAGGHYFECVQEGGEIDHFFAEEKVVRIRLGLNSDALKKFGESITFPRELQPLANGETPNSFYRQGRTTPEMQVILHQILHCPYQGSIKQMYLEGKVLELSALQFLQFTEEDRTSQHTSFLKADEIERLHHAKAILTEQMENPPSILSLARQVGLNDFKLKQGFRQIFDTTVFGYLRDYRLERARLLLAEGRLSVQQVARTIGYTHAGYFAKAFKRKFGVNPKAYQLDIIQAPVLEIKKSRE
ncbi:MAG: helix-turn-helix transcriptional regulator [Elainellaceae cyanobacterium]